VEYATNDDTERRGYIAAIESTVPPPKHLRILVCRLESVEKSFENPEFEMISMEQLLNLPSLESQCKLFVGFPFLKNDALREKALKIMDDLAQHELQAKPMPRFPQDALDRCGQELDKFVGELMDPSIEYSKPLLVSMATKLSALQGMTKAALISEGQHIDRREKELTKHAKELDRSRRDYQTAVLGKVKSAQVAKSQAAEEKPFKCPDCEYKAKQKNTLLKHLSRAHPQGGNEIARIQEQPKLGGVDIGGKPTSPRKASLRPKATKPAKGKSEAEKVDDDNEDEMDYEGSD
jgi:hypothetical protein